MKLVKKMVVIAGVAAVALTSFAVFAKIQAAPGNHILNMGGNTYTTTNPAGCAGVTFPASVGPETVNPNSDNQITVDPTVAKTESCSSMYTSTASGQYYSESYCLVTLKLKHGKVVEMGAHGGSSGQYADEGCKAIGNTDVMILSSGS